MYEEKVVSFDKWKEKSEKPIWLLDRKTAIYMVNMASEVENGYRWYFEECPICGGQYISKLGHRCEDTLEIICDNIDEVSKRRFEKEGE